MIEHIPPMVAIRSEYLAKDTGWYVHRDVNVSSVMVEYVKTGGGVTEGSLHPTLEGAYDYAIEYCEEYLEKVKERIEKLESAKAEYLSDRGKYKIT